MGISAALFMMVKNWKQLKRPLEGEKRSNGAYSSDPIPSDS